MMMSASVTALPDMVKSAAWLKVSEFNEWDAGNDPHHEHDFLSLELCNRKFFGSAITTRQTWNADQ